MLQYARKSGPAKEVMKKRNLVYSTDKAQMCEKCEQHEDNCICKDMNAIVGDGKVRVMLDTKGRKGKGVSVITGLAVTEKELKAMAKELKALCGTGGAVKNACIEIQGDHRDKLIQALAKKGIQAKKSGG